MFSYDGPSLHERISRLESDVEGPGEMTVYTVQWAPSFKRDYKLAIRRGLKVEKLQAVVGILAMGERLAPKYKDHILKGKFAGLHECHVAPDWLLVYDKFENTLTLKLVRTGTHDDLGLE